MKRALAGCALALVVGCSGESDRDAALPPSPPPPASAPPADSVAKTDPVPPPAPAAASPESLAEEGRSVYQANCIACHAPDPTQDGPLGPAVAGASAELLYARVVQGTYPEGYAPKRDTRAMIPLPHLEAKIEALAAYLAESG